MRATVLRDARLARRAGQFVWLSIDTEDGRNAPFLERFPVQVWPTFAILAPGDGRTLVRWEGGATRAQLEQLLDEGLRALRGSGAAPRRATGSAGAMAALARVTREQAAGSLEACAAAAREEAQHIARGAAWAGVVAGGLSCALDASADAAWRRQALEELEPLAADATQLPRLTADDRAGLYELRVAAREAQGDAPGAHALAERWWAFLEAERRRASSPEQRAALDSYRVSAARALGDPARALPSLAESERELPHDYNPPARSARLLLDLGRLAEARAAVERALRKAYGPRKVRVYELAASIAEREQDRDAAASLLDDALAYLERLPSAQRDASAVARLQARRRSLEGSGSGATTGGGAPP